MPFGQGTFLVDGQRTTLPPAAAYAPMNFGVQTSGVPTVSPTVPPVMGIGTVGGVQSGSGMAYNSVGEYGTADNNSAATAEAAAHPFSLRSSPVLWAVGLLVTGLVLLQVINWHETIDESGSVGGAHERASESAGS